MTLPLDLIHKRYTAEIQESLSRVQHEFWDNPAGMEYFYQLHLKNLDQRPRNSGSPRVGIMCIHVPLELVLAAGAVPVRLCSGSETHAQVGSEYTPARTCPLVKAALGSLRIHQESGASGLDLIINPTTCDQKKKAAEHIQDLGYPVYTLEVPPSRDSEAGRAYWRSSIWGLARDIGQYTGVPITRKNLDEAMRLVGAAQREYRRLEELRRSLPPPMLGKDMFLVAGALFMDDLERWTRGVAELVREMRERVDKGFAAAQNRAPRILFTGAPSIFPHFKLALLVEQSGGVIVADEICSAHRMLHDMAVVEERQLYDMVDALADRTLKPCTCPVFSSSRDRQRRILEMTATSRADGVIYQVLSGCQVYEMEYSPVARTLEEQGIPVMFIETDYGPEDMGQLSTRVEAFIESIKARMQR